MTKIYEALELARRDQLDVKSRQKVPLYVPQIVQSHRLDLDEEIASLYKNMDVVLSHVSRRVIQFVGVTKGDGTSTVASEFAHFAAANSGKTVLLLDADRLRPSMHQHFDLGGRNSWIEALVKGGEVAEAMYQIGESKLFVSPSCNSASFTPEIFDSNRTESFWNTLRYRFDLVVIDSPPFSDSPDALAFAPQADGIILVIQSEKTRTKTAENLKKNILKVGGNLLGVVLNKRRYYIPQFIYKYL